MEPTQTLYAAVQKCYDHLYDAITELAKHPDDDNCAMWEALAHDDYDRVLEAYVMAREKEAKAAWDRGGLPL